MLPLAYLQGIKPKTLVNTLFFYLFAEFIYLHRLHNSTIFCHGICHRICHGDDTIFSRRYKTKPPLSNKPRG